MATDNEYSNYSYNNSWENGRFKKSYFHCPTLGLYLRNIKRLILQNLAATLAIVADNEDLPYLGTEGLPSEGLKLFTEKTIHFGISKDPNAHALYMQISRKGIFSSNSKREDIEVKIAATTGATDDFDSAISFATAYLEAINMILEVVDPRELTFGWAGKSRPGIAIGGETQASPTVLALSTDLGAVPELIFNFVVFPQRNVR